MSMKKQQAERKPLRQRVADRKRGIKEVKPVSHKKERFLRFSKLFLNTMQYLGLLLLLITLGQIVSNDYNVENWNLIIVYCAMFIIGRGGITIQNSFSEFK